MTKIPFSVPTSTSDDFEYISKFVLGRHWNKIDSQTKKSFIKSFNDYLIMVYAPKFKGWNGEFKTIGSQFENNMYIVAMSLVSKGKKCAHLYFGDKIKGMVKTTIVNGKIVYDNKKFYKYKNNNFFVSPMLGNKI